MKCGMCELQLYSSSSSLCPHVSLTAGCWWLPTRLPLSCCVSTPCACREKVSSALFFKYNTQLGPPYQVLVDTNFINFSIKNKVSPRP
jgi:hypothetical protein